MSWASRASHGARHRGRLARNSSRRDSIEARRRNRVEVVPDSWREVARTTGTKGRPPARRYRPSAEQTRATAHREQDSWGLRAEAGAPADREGYVSGVAPGRSRRHGGGASGCASDRGTRRERASRMHVATASRDRPGSHGTAPRVRANSARKRRVTPSGRAMRFRARRTVSGRSRALRSTTGTSTKTVRPRAFASSRTAAVRDRDPRPPVRGDRRSRRAAGSIR